MKPDRFVLIVAAWLSGVNSIAMSIVAPLISVGFVTWGMFLEGFAVSFGVSLVLSLVIPASLWGGKLADACNRKRCSFSWRLISTAVPASLLTTIVSFVMVAYFAGVGPHLVPAWLAVFPHVLLAVYAATLIAEPAGTAIAKRFCRAPKKARFPRFQ